MSGLDPSLPVQLADVLAARRNIAPYLQPTPMYHYFGLSTMAGCEIWVKHENHQPVGAFKVRGGINLLANLPEEQRQRGVITASTGNHGQSVAYAARLFGVRAIVAVPKGANPAKVASMKSLGAEVVFHGVDFDEAREWVEVEAAEQGYRYIHSGNEPLLIAGVGTCTLEVLERQPRLDAIIVPVGMGSGVAAACLVAKTISPQTQIIAVQAEEAPAAYLSWREGRPVSSHMRTFAEGLATRTSADLPQEIMRRYLDEFVLVSEDEMRRAIVTLLAHTRNLAEGAGAAALAAAIKLRHRLQEKHVAIILSGGNISVEQLREILAAEGAPSFNLSPIE
ncbi:MAG: threonine/serine dehydratase [Caldilineales bacterium]|nr:threonine/serine dehydratase [Caldilineales bacterium]